MTKKEINKIFDSIPEMYKLMLELLKKQEGGYLHKNSTEYDITTGYGIYKYLHPKAKIFDYIIPLGVNKGLPSNSSKWTNVQCKNIVTPLIDAKTELVYSYLFYKDYFSSIDIEKMHHILIPTIVSLGANSMNCLRKSIQRGINMIIEKYDAYDIPALKVDGVLGPKTYSALSMIIEHGDEAVEELKDDILDCARNWYTSLATSNPDKYGIYLKGWLNRVEDTRIVHWA